MTELVLATAKLSLFTSLLIGILLLLVPLLQKRYRAKWRYFAWLLIALRLLIPVNISLPRTPIQIELPEQVVEVATPQPVEQAATIQQEVRPETAQLETNSAGPAGEPLKNSLSPVQVAGGVWVAGVAVFLLFQLISYQTFLRKLTAAQREEVPQIIKETVWNIGVEMGICRLPEPVITQAIDAPVLIGVLHPRVLLPHGDYSGEEIAFILRHELVHYRRRDMWYKLVLLLASALHWFNPLVHLMTLQAAKDIELACDDDVVHELDREARARYGGTILAALPKKRRLEPVFSTHFGSTKQTMKGRLGNLFDMAVKRRGVAALCTVALCAATLTGMVTFAGAAPKTGEAPDITRGQTLSIPSIEVGQAVCVGQIEMGPEISHTVSVSAASGSGWFVALHESPSITEHGNGVLWNSHYGGGGSSNYFHSDEAKTRYVYVGSQANAGTRLTEVTVTITPTGISPEEFSQSASTVSPAAPGRSIHVRAADGTWALASEVEGRSEQEQLGFIADWLDTVNYGKNSSFVITETIPESEIANVQGTQALYQASEVYRTMSGMQNGAFQVRDNGSFSTSGLPSGRVYERTAVMVGNGDNVEVSARYRLTTGKMTIQLINPSGKLVYWGDLAKSYDETFTVAGAQGLWSVVVVSEPENGAVAGSCELSLKTVNNEAQNTASTTATDTANFSVQRLGRHTLQSGDVLSTDIGWEGRGTVMLLYTDKDFTDDEILVPLQGLPGLPKPNYDNVDQEKVRGTFNIKQSSSSPLTGEQDITETGTYYFYILQYDFDTINSLTGGVSSRAPDKTIDIIWTQAGWNVSGNLTSTFASGDESASL